jgi:hypothetical protein
MLPAFDRADVIDSCWGNPKTRTFAELLIREGGLCSAGDVFDHDLPSRVAPIPDVPCLPSKALPEVEHHPAAIAEHAVVVPDASRSGRRAWRLSIPSSDFTPSWRSSCSFSIQR